MRYRCKQRGGSLSCFAEGVPSFWDSKLQTLQSVWSLKLRSVNCWLVSQPFWDLWHESDLSILRTVKHVCMVTMSFSFSNQHCLDIWPLRALEELKVHSLNKSLLYGSEKFYIRGTCSVPYCQNSKWNEGISKNNELALSRSYPWSYAWYAMFYTLFV